MLHRQQRLLYPGKPYDYSTLHTIWDEFLDEGLMKHTKWPRDPNDPDGARRYWQDRLYFNPVKSCMPHTRVRLHHGQLMLDVEGDGTVLSAPPLALSTFNEKLCTMGHQWLDNFTALSEEQKTRVLLYRLAGIKVRLAARGFSWILAPQLWVLSQRADFANINRLLLDLGEKRAQVSQSLRDALLLRTGVMWSACNREWVLSNGTSAELRELIFSCAFAPSRMLLAKYVAYNGFTSGENHSLTKSDFAGSQLRSFLCWTSLSGTPTPDAHDMYTLEIHHFSLGRDQGTGNFGYQLQRVYRQRFTES